MPAQPPDNDCHVVLARAQEVAARERPIVGSTDILSARFGDHADEQQHRQEKPRDHTTARKWFRHRVASDQPITSAGRLSPRGPGEIFGWGCLSIYGN